MKYILSFLVAVSTCFCHEELKVSWDEVHDMVREVSSKISIDDYDLLFGVSVGGLVPTALFSLELGCKNVATVSARSYDGRIQKELSISNAPSKEDLKGKRILLIDDLVDSGKTISTIRNALINEYEVESVDVACLFMKPTSKIKPDYVSQETDAWITFPWEIKD